jgi:hypothetical protein
MIGTLPISPAGRFDWGVNGVFEPEEQPTSAKVSKARNTTTVRIVIPPEIEIVNKRSYLIIQGNQIG